MGVLDTLATARPGTASVKVIIDADARRRWEAATRNLDAAVAEDAKAATLESAGVGPATTAAFERLDEIRDEVAASEVEFVFAKIAWTEHIAMQAAHPPVKGNPIHAHRGYNVETFTDALIRASCVLAIGTDGTAATGVHFDPDQHKVPEDVQVTGAIPATTWDTLLGIPATETEPAVSGSLNLRQVNDLASRAQDVNEGTIAVPPSARSSLGTQASGASSTPPKPGQDHPRSGSTGGSRPGSPTSSTTSADTRSLEDPPAT